MGLRGLAAGALAALAAWPALAETADPFCSFRQARSDRAWAVVVVQADKTTETSAAGRGDHCDVQYVDGRVLKVLRGPMQTGQAVRFALSQGACGVSNSVNDDFVETGARLVVLLQRLPTGEIDQIQAESPGVYEARQQSCARAVSR